MATVDELRKLPSAEARATQAQAFITRGGTALDGARTIRNQAVRDLRSEGWTQARIAAILGVTQAAVAKIINPQPKEK